MLPKLILLEKNQVISRYEIDQETFTIGRKPENDLIIDHPAVSGRHARILIIGSDAFIEDLQSTNGTLINNRRVSKHMLQHGDTILIGKHTLQFKAVGQSDDDQSATAKPYAFGMEGTAFDRPLVAPKASPQSKEPEPELTQNPTVKSEPEPENEPEPDMEVEPKPDLEAEVAAEVEPEPESEPEPTPEIVDTDKQEALLQMISGPQSGTKIALNRSISRLGKPGEQVAVIARRPGGYFLMHLGGNTAQPLLNGEVVGTQATLLSDDDIIEVGKIKMKFLLV